MRKTKVCIKCGSGFITYRDGMYCSRKCYYLRTEFTEMVKSKRESKKMKCNCCGNVLEESTTTFTVVKKNEVYVVENVTCLECPFCEHISFTQEVTKKLERYVSGRVVPAKTMKSWVYKWGDPIIEILKTEPSTTTVTTRFI